MKLTFGDLNSKQLAIQAHKDKQRFERSVDNAMQVMNSFLVLPDERANMVSYPHHVRHFPLDVLREAGRRIRKLRQG